MTPDSDTSRPRVHQVTWLGLFIALFGMLIVRQAVSFVWPTVTFAAALWKESLIWVCVILLLLIIRRGEGLRVTSVGIGTSAWWKSLVWGLALGVICFLVAALLASVTHYTGGSAGEAFSKLPLWLITLSVVRAGVVEELFYRGYAIERLQALGLNRYAAAAIPVIIFSVGHWTGGWANILIALALGVILSWSYLWRRDLVANMIGHFLVDFIANVVPKLFS